MRLYHISRENDTYTLNLDCKKLFPRVPDNLYQDDGGNIIEDSKTRRICWSRTIGGCLRAVSDTHGLGCFSVYCGDFDETDVIFPTKEQVPDCKITKEVWTVKPCNVKRLGFINSYKPFQPLSERIRWYFIKNPLNVRKAVF